MFRSSRSRAPRGDALPASPPFNSVGGHPTDPERWNEAKPGRSRLKSGFLVGSHGFLVVLSMALGDPGFGRNEALAVPADPVNLLTAAPFDRLTLIDGAVIVIEPVSPRPLPVIDPKKNKVSTKLRGVPQEGNIGVPEQPAAEDDEDAAESITIHIADGPDDVRDYRVKRASIKTIEYYEDLLLAEAERLSAERRFGSAFEHLLKARERNPEWPRLLESADKLLFNEGNYSLLEGDGERGLRLLRELAARKPNYPELADKLGNAYGTRATKAFELGLYTLGRTNLHTAEPLAPGHRELRGVSDRFIAKAKEYVAAADASKGAERLDALAKALEVWPKLEGADAAYREAFLAVPTLSVAVPDIPRGIGPWIRSPADQRLTRLLYLPVLAKDDEESLQDKSGEPQLASKVAVADLGQRLTVDIKSEIRWSDNSRAVSTIDLARSFTERCDPAFLGYNARWADLLDKVVVTPEGQVEIKFSRPILRPGSWLTGPVGAAHVGVDGRIAISPQDRLLVGNALFQFTKTRGEEIELEARGISKIKRLREARYPDQKKMIGAFERGEVTMLAHLPADQVAKFASTDDVKVGRYVHPVMHSLAFDARNPAFRNRSLRRGLSYAINRAMLLEDVILKRPADAVNCVSDGPFPKLNYADAPDVAPFTYDPLLARMLIVAAKRELGNQPLKFNLDYPAIPEAQVVVPRMVEALKILGVEIIVHERPESELEQSLRAGERFDIAYRAIPCREPVTDVGPLISPGYDAPPARDTLTSIASPRILQLLLQLERAPEFPTAKGLVTQIDRECRDELPMLPLWQLEDHYAWRSRLTGPPEVTEDLYRGLETWEIQPWFLKDPW